MDVTRCFRSRQERFVVCFKEDREITEVSPSDIENLENVNLESHPDVNVLWKGLVYYEAKILQAIPKDGWSSRDLISKLKELVKEKNASMETLIRQCPIVQPNKRVRIQPLNTFQTESDSEGHCKAKRRRIQPNPIVIPDPGPLLHQRSEQVSAAVPASSKQCHTSTLQMQNDGPPPFPQPAVSSSFTRKRKLPRESLSSTYDEPSSNPPSEPISILSLYREQKKIRYEIKEIKDLIKELMASHGKCSSISSPKFDAISSTEEFLSFLDRLQEESFGSDFVHWLSFANSSNVEKSVRRMLNGLLCQSLQLRCNRTGRNGKVSVLPIEPFVKAAIRRSHEAITDGEIERAIADCLINSRDRGLGRDRRRHKSAPSKPQETANDEGQSADVSNHTHELTDFEVLEL